MTGPTNETTATSVSWRGVLSTSIRLLTFRARREELVALSYRHLAFGLLCTWIVGIGRYWDNPRVGLPQHLGVGSVVYVFLLSLFLWLIVWPLRPQHWSYLRVLGFVSLVSPPAILYALPVEKFYPIDTANSINVLFLGFVAIWRVALLVFFLRRLGELQWFSIVVATLLPITIIVVSLTALNLERVVLDVMGGVRPGTASDASYAILFLLSALAVLLFIPLLICYAMLAVSAGVAARQAHLKKIYDQ